jgi:hypothetical protein
MYFVHTVPTTLITFPNMNEYQVSGQLMLEREYSSRQHSICWILHRFALQIGVL